MKRNNKYYKCRVNLSAFSFSNASWIYRIAIVRYMKSSSQVSLAFLCKLRFFGRSLRDNSRYAADNSRRFLLSNVSIEWDTQLTNSSEVSFVCCKRIYNRFHATNALQSLGTERYTRCIFDFFGETEAGLAYFLYKENF